MTAAVETASERMPRALVLVVAAASISMLIVQMDWFALTLALPVIARDFDVATTNLQWVVSGYMLSLGALMIPAGRLADIYGRKRMLVLGLLTFAALSAVCGAAQDEQWLITARIVQGVGAALIFPVAIAVVSNAFPGKGQGRAISVVLACAAIGTALGPFVGGTFAQHVTWRAVFFINIPFCLVAAALVFRHVRESRDETASRHVDLAGAATVTAGLVAIMYAIDKGQDWGWTSGLTLGLAAAGVVLLAVFVLVEARVRNPLVDLALFRNRPFVVVTVSGSVSNVVYSVVAFLSALYLQQARGYSPFDSGLVFLSLSAGAATASFYAGSLAERIAPVRLMAIAMIVSAASLGVLTSLHSLWAYTPVLGCCGLGLGLAWALTNVATQAVVPPQVVGEASGIALTSLVVIAALAVTLASTVLELISGSAETAASDAGAIQTVLRAIAVLAFATAVVLLLLGRHRSPRPEALAEPA